MRRIAMALAALLVGCATGDTETFVPAAEVVVFHASEGERAAVEDAAAWWRACGYDVEVRDQGVSVIYMADASDLCAIDDTLGCYLPDLRLVAVRRGTEDELLRVVVAHEIGHVLGKTHKDGPLMWAGVSRLEDAPCVR